MKRLRVKDGCFVHPNTFEPLHSVEVVITNRGSLSRSYYDGEGALNCWSYDCDFPDPNVPASKRQASRCIDCVQSIQRGGFGKGTPCRFFTVIHVAFLGMEQVFELRVNALSLFAKDGTDLNLYKYIEYLEDNQEQVEDVITEIYLGDSYGTHKMYFKPVRPLREEELANIQQLVRAAPKESNPFETIKEQEMAYSTYIIKNVEALYPHLDQPYKFDSKAGKRGQSVPCDAADDGAGYELNFNMNKDQAKALYKVMQDAYVNHKGRDKSWPDKLDMPFEKSKNDTDLFVGKARLKAMYGTQATKPPAQYDAKNQPLESGFKLTTGSTVNIAVELVPYKMAATGVSLRLRGVQVLKYLPYKPPSPFDAEEGFSADENSGSPFESNDGDDMFESEDTPKPAADPDPFDDEEEEVKEPVKRKKKKDETPDDDDDIADIIDVWGDDDD